ncbi:MAG: pyruvate kinase [Syntrophobacterales bacterium]|nr:MAG: pyruvate kinase [Syntrophobacterales bacterium]
MRKTKIVCTIGPASESAEVIEELIRSGMDVARLNFSHGTIQEHESKIESIRRISQELSKNVSILQDLAGPKIRIGVFQKGYAILKPRSWFTLTTRDVTGDEHQVSVSYTNLPMELNPGDAILLDDGALELEVVETNPTDIRCRVMAGGHISSRKGVNLPSGTSKIPSLTENDRRNLIFGIKMGIDFVALSYVRRAEDIKGVRDIMESEDSKIPIIAKIETRKALDNIDGILEDVDGIMVARGDLGVETPLEKVPLVQKMLIRKANALSKPVVTATQMLGSMVNNPRPTRAEVTDIANAIFDGTDALMLSEETALGNYPIESVKTMANIATASEGGFPYELFENRGHNRRGYTPDAISYGACLLAREVNAKAIVTPTESGMTARLVSRHRPSHPIIALSPNEETIKQLNLSWGVIPIKVDKFEDTDDMIEKAKRITMEMDFAKKGEKIVLTAGLPIGIPGNTNTIKIALID